MENANQATKEYYTIDLVHIALTLWRRIWIVALCGILCAAMGFALSAYVIAPKYSSAVMLYVNNSSFSLGNTSFSISSSEITAAQSLVKTYAEILNNRTTLEKVIQKTGVPYTYKQLSKMVIAEPSNETEILKITVTTEDPYEASKIANSIAEVLPVRISEIIDGATMEVVDSAIPILGKVEPSTSKYTAVGLVLGMFFSAMIIIIVAIADDTIYDEEYVLKTYNYPILAKIPDLLSSDSGRYSYYKSYKKSSKSE